MRAWRAWDGSGGVLRRGRSAGPRVADLCASWHGIVEPPESKDGYRIAGYEEDLESLRIHLGVDTLTLYGHSHGGMVALAYACGSPKRVARLVVMNAPPRLDDAYKAAAAEVQRRFAETFPDGAERLAGAEAADAALETDLPDDQRRRHFRTLMARYVARQGPGETAYLDRLCAAPMNWQAADVMYAEMLDGLDLLSGSDKVTAPVLAIAGEFDVVVPPASMRLIADALPNGRYFEFRGVGPSPWLRRATLSARRSATSSPTKQLAPTARIPRRDCRFGL